ncbi:MAG: hypothetical protein R3C19_25210 [Planctomycetaceae bacterium]
MSRQSVLLIHSRPVLFSVPMLATVFAAINCLLTAGPAVAQDGDSDEPVFIVPGDLIQDALTEEAGEETANRISPRIQTLYNTEATPEDRLKAAAELRADLPGLPTASLRSRLRRRVDLVEAGIKALQVTPAPTDEQQKLVTDLVSAANAFEDQNLSTNAVIVRERYRTLKSSSPAIMSVLRPVMMQHYFNHNVHITVSETILSQLVSDYRCKSGGVADCILGAWVTGSQVTNVNITADIKPSASYGSFNLLADGQTQSNTSGRKDPATIYTRGNHSFHIVSPVVFTGETLSAGASTINVTARNQLVGFKTDYDGIPIIRHFARKIALRKIQETHGQAESIAARKLANEALPEFTAEVNQKFAEANTQIQSDLLQGLRNKGVAPDSISSRSSESHLAVSSRTMGLSRLAGSPQPFSPIPYRGLAIQVHETAVNNALDGMELNGREIPEKELDQELQKALSELLQRDISFAGMQTHAAEPADEEEPESTFLFSDNDPIRFRFDDGKVVLMLRMGIRQEGRDDIPEHHIEVPIDVTLQNGKLLLSPPTEARDIRVAPLGARSLRGVAQAAQIRRVIRARLPVREINPSMSLKLSDTRQLSLHLIDIQTADGWLYTDFQ